MTHSVMEAKPLCDNIGINFMTSQPVTYGWVSDDVAYEITEGIGIAGERIWGVSFRNKWEPKKATDYSSMVISREAADEYVELIREELG